MQMQNNTGDNIMEEQERIVNEYYDTLNELVSELQKVGLGEIVVNFSDSSITIQSKKRRSLEKRIEALEEIASHPGSILGRLYNV
jgi:hypothetical protein